MEGRGSKKEVGERESEGEKVNLNQSVDPFAKVIEVPLLLDERIAVLSVEPY